RRVRDSNPGRHRCLSGFQDRRPRPLGEPSRRHEYYRVRVYAMTIPEPGRMEWAVVPDPTPTEHEVLVEVAASAVNRADLLQVAGFYPPPPGAPPYPGLECSGVAEGRDVCALLSGGGYAERVAVPREHLMRVPDGVSLADAAALPEAACTV